MGERIPRRLRRFERKGEIMPNQEVQEMDYGETSLARPMREEVPQPVGPEERKEVSKEITMQLALEEVEKFKVTHKRLPKKAEYDKIAESIYSQLRDKEQRKKAAERFDRKSPGAKKTSKERRSHGRKKTGGSQTLKESAFAELKSAAMGETAIPDSKHGIADLSVADIFGTEKETGKKPRKNMEDEFSLSGLEGTAGKEDEFSLGGLSDLEQGKGEGKCPNCKAPTEDIVFCPECGTAFCDKCAKNLEVLGKTKIYTCPSCDKKIKR